MLKINDPKFHTVSYGPDKDGYPAKFVGDHLVIKHYTIDLEANPPSVTVTCRRIDADGNFQGPQEQFLVSGDALIELIKPSPDQPNRQAGDFRMSDIEDIILAGRYEQPRKDEFHKVLEKVVGAPHFERLIIK